MFKVYLQSTLYINMNMPKNPKILLTTVSSTMRGQIEYAQEISKKVATLLEEFMELEDIGVITSVAIADQTMDHYRNGNIAGAIIVVATGGTERIIKTIARTFKKPILLIAHPYSNSLASSIEAYASLNEDKIAIKLLYSNLDKEILNDIKRFINVCKAVYKIGHSKLGQIGAPSPWILTSKSPELIKNRLGTDIIRLEVADLFENISKIRNDDVKNIVNKIKEMFGEIVEPKDEELIEAVKIYFALKDISSKNELSAITLRCFDLIAHDVTGCIGISLSNDNGLVAGCEADIDAALTMMILNALTNEPVWIANIARVNTKENTITLAHCTIATKMLENTKKSALRSHFESGKSVSIQGPLKRSEITLARLGGKNLDKMTIATGKIIRTDFQDPLLCRTQAEIKLNGDVQKFIMSALGNHQVLAYGNLTQELLDFCRFKNIEPIII